MPDLNNSNSPNCNIWPIPVPLTSEAGMLPEFPMDAFPEYLKNYVLNVSEATQTSPDMAAIAVLGVLATAVQGKYRVRIKPDYFEPLNLFVLIIAPPGERKSSVMQLTCRILGAYEKLENERRKPAFREYQIKKDLLTGEIKSMKEQTVRSSCNEDQQTLLQKQEELDELEEVRMLRLTADDSSPEALTSLMADCDGSISVVSSEGGIFDIMAGRYSNQKPNIDVFLKGYSGDTIRVDRKMREPEYIESPVLTMLLSIQPGVISEAMENNAMNSRGLISRFLFSVPVSRIGSRSFLTPSIDPAAAEKYESAVTTLLSMPAGKEPYTISFSKEALEEISGFFDVIEKELKDNYSSIREWLSKLVGNTCRIAAILHLASGFSPDQEISVSTVKDAERISDYFKKHAEYIFSSMALDESVRKALFVLTKIKDLNMPVISKRDLFRSCRGRYFKTLDDFRPTLTLLEEYGYLFRQMEDAPGCGKPREILVINPELLKEQSSMDNKDNMDSPRADP
jgi:hypothetical protein